MTAQPQQHFNLFPVGSQRIHVAFDGGKIVSAAGLLAVRALEKPLRVIADLAQRLPDPRSPQYIEHSSEAILTQAVYQILAGYPDGNDAQQLRDDPLFQSRIVAKIEVTPQGSQRRFVVTNMKEEASVVYRDFYVQRGKVPEQPIGEMKNGLRAERLSACGFCANSFRLLVHTLAYAIVVLFREASSSVAEAATLSVSTLRQRLWKVGAVVVTSVRRIHVHFSSTWPFAEALKADSSAKRR